MSLNCAMLSNDGRSVIPLPQEKVFFTQDKIKLELDCSENDYPGNSGGHWTSQGLVILSNRRIVFIADTPSESLQTLNIPILHFKNWKLEQPWFGANYIEGTVIPVQNGGLVKNGKLTLVFREGGTIEFTNLLRALSERLAETNEIPSHLEPLPTYQAEGSSTGSDQVYPPPPSNQVYPPPPSNQAYPPPPSNQLMSMPTPPNPTMPVVPNQDLPPAYQDIDHH
ncbi:hypothetical protein BC941DRAFT_428931 [Chlamydoabsidia padenii]|nr:hypothetical protein BC941DRAFT_428931 [Chlamydoabsidia padenii]